MALARVAVDGLGEALRRDSPMSHLSPSGLLASRLGVSRRTVNRWLSGGIQGCDLNVDRLIELALLYSPAGVEEALRADLESHRVEVEMALSELARGTGG
jgi:transcriptional regulator with XRE-family HTH domain